ncbi:MAG: hypothetical protein IMW89_15260 [Ktedonobacteraceae bacterium]|nr:hypothetical protein [Ktedonobacteraceae bacterium]
MIQLSSSEKFLAFVRSRLFLIVIGLTCELLYILCFVRQFPLLRYYQGLTDMANITEHSHVGFVLFILPFTLLFAMLAFAWWEVRKLQDRETLWLILGFGALFAATMIFVYPVTAIDIFGYVVQSLVLVQHYANPMVTPAATYPDDPMMQLAGGWINLGAPYGPLGILIDAIPTVLVGRNLLANLLLLKAMFSVMYLVEAYLVYKILSHYAPKLALAGALLIAWNPQGFFEYSANGHNDVAAMLFVLLAILALTKKRHTLAFGLVIASALVKYATLPLLPLFFLYGVVHQPVHLQRLRYAAQAFGVALLLIVAFYGPFWAGPHTFDTSLDQERYFISSFSTLVYDMSSGQITAEQAKLFGRVLFGLCYLYALYLTTKGLGGLLRAGFVTLFYFLAFATGKFEVWYAIWPALFAVLIPRINESLATMLFLYGATLSAAVYAYLWVWGGGTGPMWDMANSLAYLITFAPALILLVGLALRRRLVYTPEVEAKNKSSNFLF